jgi:hypothetical protein
MVTTVLEDPRPAFLDAAEIGSGPCIFDLSGWQFMYITSTAVHGQNFLFRAGAGLDKRAPECSLAASVKVIEFEFKMEQI